ncbi:hypothetical protein NL676_034409 [Syzygium grande]|nr:hypothetical protein NL676_034409 [Syzygium grande]
MRCLPSPGKWPPKQAWWAIEVGGYQASTAMHGSAMSKRFRSLAEGETVEFLIKSNDNRTKTVDMIGLGSAAMQGSNHNSGGTQAVLTVAGEGAGLWWQVLFVGGGGAEEQHPEAATPLGEGGVSVGFVVPRGEKWKQPSSKRCRCRGKLKEWNFNNDTQREIREREVGGPGSMGTSQSAIVANKQGHAMNETRIVVCRRKP